MSPFLFFSELMFSGPWNPSRLFPSSCPLALQRAHLRLFQFFLQFLRSLCLNKYFFSRWIYFWSSFLLPLPLEINGG